MAYEIIDSTKIPEGYRNYLSLPIPEYISPIGAGEGNDVWGIRYKGETYAWIRNFNYDFNDPEQRELAAEAAADFAIMTGLDCRIGAPIDKDRTRDEKFHYIYLDPEPNQYGFYLKDPGDKSSHDQYVDIIWGDSKKKPMNKYTPAQRSHWRVNYERVMQQLTPQKVTKS